MTTIRTVIIIAMARITAIITATTITIRGFVTEQGPLFPSSDRATIGPRRGLSFAVWGAYCTFPKPSAKTNKRTTGMKKLIAAVGVSLIAVVAMVLSASAADDTGKKHSPHRRHIVETGARARAAQEKEKFQL